MPSRISILRVVKMLIIIYNVDPKGRNVRKFPQIYLTHDNFTTGGTQFLIEFVEKYPI